MIGLYDNLNKSLLNRILFVIVVCLASIRLKHVIYAALSVLTLAAVFMTGYHFG